MNMTLRFNLKNSALFALLSFMFLAGCGSEEVSDSQTPPSPNATSLSGKAADGYLRNAKACLDLNNNTICDLDEPYAMTTGDEGEYAIDIKGLSAAKVNNANIVVEVIAGETVDMDDPNNKVVHGYTLTAPPKAEFVSPLTTLVVETMQNEVLDEQQAKKIVARKIVGNEAADSFDPSADYIVKQQQGTAEDKQQYAKAHRVAKAVAQTMGEEKSRVKETLGDVDTETLQALIDLLVDKVLEKLDEINEKIDELGDASSDTVTITLDVSTSSLEVHKEKQKEEQNVERVSANALENEVLYGVYFDARVERDINDEGEVINAAATIETIKFSAMLFKNGRMYSKDCDANALEVCADDLANDNNITGSYEVEGDDVFISSLGVANRYHISKATVKNISGKRFINEEYWNPEWLTYFLPDIFPVGGEAVIFNFLLEGIPSPNESQLTYESLCGHPDHPDDCNKVDWGEPATNLNSEIESILSGQQEVSLLPTEKDPHIYKDRKIWLNPKDTAEFVSCRYDPALYESRIYNEKTFECVDDKRKVFPSRYKYDKSLEALDGRTYDRLIILEGKNHLYSEGRWLEVFFDFGDGKILYDNIAVDDIFTKYRLFKLQAANKIANSNVEVKLTY